MNFTGLHPFIITLGTNAIFRGITLIVSGASPVFGFPYSFTGTFAGSILYVPVPILVALGMAVILVHDPSYKAWPQHLCGRGAIARRPFFSGIDVKLHTLIVFMISGLCAGLAGVLSTARLGAAEPAAGTGFETYAIASAIIGGTSFFGAPGRPSPRQLPRFR
ncbi:hypothetical protein LZK74_25515 (plasmid) [Sinorhizobium meliloti]|nr:hypothetical protein LZK74_25515 [Sinorhizobium meliloti]